MVPLWWLAVSLASRPNHSSVSRGWVANLGKGPNLSVGLPTQIGVVLWLKHQHSSASRSLSVPALAQGEDSNQLPVFSHLVALRYPSQGRDGHSFPGAVMVVYSFSWTCILITPYPGAGQGPHLRCPHFLKTSTLIKPNRDPKFDTS